jgi:hypothetical protein
VSLAKVPATPLEDELAGTVFEMTRLAAKIPTLTVLTEAFPEGSRRTKTLSVEATLAAVANCETFLLLSVIIYSISLSQEE